MVSFDRFAEGGMTDIVDHDAAAHRPLSILSRGWRNRRAGFAFLGVSVPLWFSARLFLHHKDTEAQRPESDEQITPDAGSNGCSSNPICQNHRCDPNDPPMTH